MESTNSSKRGGYFKGSHQSSQADPSDKWNHSGFDEVAKDKRAADESEAPGKFSQDYSKNYKDESSYYQGQQSYHHYNDTQSYRNYNYQNYNKYGRYKN